MYEGTMSGVGFTFREQVISKLGRISTDLTHAGRENTSDGSAINRDAEMSTHAKMNSILMKFPRLIKCER